MIEEHHISTFDAGSFFSLHDFDSSGAWTPDEVRRMYGLDDESTKDVSREKREEVTREVYRLFDADHNGLIEREEFVRSGEVMPDFGVRAAASAEREGCYGQGRGVGANNGGYIAGTGSSWRRRVRVRDPSFREVP